jgi:hypothetical protein
LEAIGLAVLDFVSVLNKIKALQSELTDIRKNRRQARDNKNIKQMIYNFHIQTAFIIYTEGSLKRHLGKALMQRHIKRVKRGKEHKGCCAIVDMK